MNEKIRLRHLRKRDGTPVATMATLERDGKLFVSFSFCSKHDIFLKWFGRNVAIIRAKNYANGKRQHIATETDKETLLSFIEKIKGSNLKSSGDFLRIAKKKFGFTTRTDPQQAQPPTGFVYEPRNEASLDL